MVTKNMAKTVLDLWNPSGPVNAIGELHADPYHPCRSWIGAMVGPGETMLSAYQLYIPHPRWAATHGLIVGGPPLSHV